MAPNNLKCWVTLDGTNNPQFNLRWDYLTGVTQFDVYRKLEGVDVYTKLITVTGLNYTDTSVIDNIAYYYVTEKDETDASNIVFGFHFFNYNYSKDLKTIILTKLKTIDEVVDTVGDKIYSSFQQQDIVYPCIAFGINEYSIPTGNKKLRDIIVTVRILSREKSEFDKLKFAIMGISGFSYQSKEVKLHKLIEMGGKGEELDPSDNLTWFMEISFKGKIEIINLI